MKPTQPSTAVESRSDIAAGFLHQGYLRLDQQGRWWLPNGEITHPKLRLFLFKNLQLNREGEYWIVNGPQRVLVDIADTPFFVIAAAAQGNNLVLDLCDQSQEWLHPQQLFIGNDHAFYTKVKIGQNGDSAGQGHWARFSRAANNQVALFVDQHQDGYALQLGNTTYPITQVLRPSRLG